jgi:small multidrug resistance pump
MGYIYLAFAIIAEVIGTTALQASEGFSKLVPSTVVVIGYSLAFYLLSLVLKSMSMGIAYAIWAGMGIVLITVAGAVFFKQIPDVPAMIGMSLILCGVVVINLFSKTTGN